MIFQTPLFYSEKIEFTPIDLENDSAIESSWTHDLRYAQRRLGHGQTKPAAAFELKTDWEARIKKMNECKLELSYALRKRSESAELLGFFLMHWIEWKNQIANFNLLFENDAIEDEFGDEAIELVKHLAIDELNIHHLMTTIPAYAQLSISKLKSHGFSEFINRREATYFGGRYWDAISLGFIEQVIQESKQTR